MATKIGKRPTWRYGGYLLLVLLYLGWFKYGFEPLTLTYLSGAAVMYGLLAAPMPCCALNRDNKTRCRNNAKGIFRGCTIQHHKWQKVMMFVRRDSWVELRRQVSAPLRGTQSR